MRGKYIVMDADGSIRVDDPDDLREMDEGAVEYLEMVTDPETGADCTDIVDFWLDDDEFDEEDD